MADLQLKLGQSLYGGWKKISVKRSLDQFAHTFDLTLTDTEADGARGIVLGAPCQVLLDGETLVTGYVDRIRPGYGPRRRTLTVSGRSKTADLVDCSIPPGHFQMEKRQQTLLQLAQSLCGKFGIGAYSEVSDLQPIEVSKMDAEQTAFEFLEQQTRIAGVMLVTDAGGNLVITRASHRRVGTALVLGENIREADGEFSSRDRFSVYAVTGNKVDSSSVKPASQVVSEINDASFSGRYRPTTIVADELTDAEAERRAEWQRNVHYGRSKQATYTVSGWRHASDFWQPNTRVRVRDPWMGFDDAWLMIGTAEFIQDERGRRSRLTVMPPEAYDLVPLPQPGEEEAAW